MFLALLWKLSPQFPQNVAMFTFANAGFLALAAFATFRFARDRLALSTLGSAAVGVAGTVSVPALIFGVFVLSEPMFMALLLLVLIYAERVAERCGLARRAVRRAGGWRTGDGAHDGDVRRAGVRARAAFPSPLFCRRCCALLACAVFLVPWHIWVAAHGAEIPPVLLGKYGPYDAGSRMRCASTACRSCCDVIAKNARALYGMLWVMFTGSETSPAFLHPPAAIVATALIAIGAWRFARRAPVTIWFLAAYWRS